MFRLFSLALVFLFGPLAASADRALLDKPDDPYFAKFEPLTPPAVEGLLLKPDDRLAIVGDSITEQKMYSRLMETYLTVCVPQLRITARQYGWSGERAGGFLKRMKDDCLRFSPTIATTCYGMNDHEYRPYEDRIGDKYLSDQTAIVEAFQAANVRVVIGSPGPVGKMPHWVKTATGTVDDLNMSLCRLRNIDVEIAREKKVGFADVFWPMYTGGFAARNKHGPEFAIAGKDGVHPGWAGQTVMAYAFLKALGLDGDIGSLTLDLQAGSGTATEGHTVEAASEDSMEILSSRYPVCVPPGDEAKDETMAAGMAVVPFHKELNRFQLFVKNAGPGEYLVTWGEETRSYTGAALAAGINLAADFATNPFHEAFRVVDLAVNAKQSYETKQIKQVFHGLLKDKWKSAEEIQDPEMQELFALRDSEGKIDREAVIAATEKKRATLADAIRTAFVPVKHVVTVKPK